MLNRYDRSPMADEAEVKYLDGDFRVVRPGAFVRCAVTGVPIPLEELKYWSVELQEPYATPEAVSNKNLLPSPRGGDGREHKAAEAIFLLEFERDRQHAAARRQCGKRALVRNAHEILFRRDQ